MSDQFRLTLSSWVGVIWLVAATVGVTLPVVADDAWDLAARIDKHLETRWKSDGVTPAERSGDAEFLRRV